MLSHMTCGVGVVFAQTLDTAKTFHFLPDRKCIFDTSRISDMIT